MNIAGYLVASARQRPESIAVAEGRRPLLSYRQLAADAHALAEGLRRMGLLPGARVAIALPNRSDYFLLQFATWIAGGTIVPVNAKLHEREIAFILEDCEATVCFSAGKIISGLASCYAGPARLIDIDSADFHKLLIDGSETQTAVSVTDPAWLFYTSGTTGKPKGAVLSHRNLAFMSMAYFADIDRIEHTDSILHPAPLSHGGGLYALPHFAAGAVNVVPESGGFDADETCELMNHWQGVSFFAAPTMVVRLLRDTPDQGPGNLKTLIYGGAPMYVSDAIAAVDRFGPRLYHLYAQGETPMTISGLPKWLHSNDGRPSFAAELGTCGFPRTGVEIRITDEDGNDLPRGETGEVVVRSDCVMSGYWRDEVATNAALRDGWLFTGDVGHFDERNMLQLMDRSKDLIISGGTNIYPREIEEVLLRHKDIVECAVIGVPDPEWGENVVAFVVAPGAGAAIEPELDALCLNEIARFKRPKAYRIVDALPKNAYGKVLKTELRKQFS